MALRARKTPENACDSGDGANLPTSHERPAINPPGDVLSARFYKSEKFQLSGSVSQPGGRAATAPEMLATGN
jgi:hypothetical protein